MLNALLKRFDWKKIAVVYERSHIWDPIYSALKGHFDRDHTSGLEITLTASYKKADAYQGMSESLSHKFIPFLEKLPTKARSKYYL